MTGFAAATAVLASRSSETGASAGYVALLFVVLLFVATVLLIRNMSGRLKRLPKQFPDGPEQNDGPPRGASGHGVPGQRRQPPDRSSPGRPPES